MTEFLLARLAVIILIWSSYKVQFGYLFSVILTKLQANASVLSSNLVKNFAITLVESSHLATRHLKFQTKFGRVLMSKKESIS